MDKTYYDSFDVLYAVNLIKGNDPIAMKISHDVAKEVKEDKPNYGWAQKLMLAIHMVNPILFERTND